MEELNLRKLGQRIKAVRKAKEKTQDDVSEAIGISKNTISEWERGLKQPGILNMHNYCHFLGITIDELLEVKQPRTILLELTDEEQDILFSIVAECEHHLTASDVTTLRQTFHFLKQHLKALFSRAESK